MAIREGADGGRGQLKRATILIGRGRLNGKTDKTEEGRRRLDGRRGLEGRGRLDGEGRLDVRGRLDERDRLERTGRLDWRRL